MYMHADKTHKHMHMYMHADKTHKHMHMYIHADKTHKHIHMYMHADKTHKHIHMCNFYTHTPSMVGIFFIFLRIHHTDIWQNW